jgi:hypothetical protein
MSPHHRHPHCTAESSQPSPPLQHQKEKKIRAALDVTARPKERKKKKEIQETPPQS